MRAIFISYRREDSQGEAGRLFDDLVGAFTDLEVFMDVDAIQPGRDFRKAITESVLQCKVLLCMIGLDWVTCTHQSGGLRIFDPEDFVRVEISEALRRDIPVIPVLVKGARMPRLEQLPPDLADLIYRNAVEIGHARWKSDVEVLIRALRPFINEAPRHNPAPSHLPSPRSALASHEITLTAVHRLLQQVARTPSGATPLPSAVAYPTLDEALFPAPPPHGAAAVSPAQPPPLPPPPREPQAQPSQSAIEAAAIERVRQQLAHYIGPIADIVVKRAARRCASLPDLYTLVAKEIDAPPDRARFLSHVNSLQAARSPTPPPASSKP